MQFPINFNFFQKLEIQLEHVFSNNFFFQKKKEKKNSISFPNSRYFCTLKNKKIRNFLLLRQLNNWIVKEKKKTLFFFFFSIFRRKKDEESLRNLMRNRQKMGKIRGGEAIFLAVFFERILLFFGVFFLNFLSFFKILLIFLKNQFFFSEFQLQKLSENVSCTWCFVGFGKD